MISFRSTSDYPKTPLLRAPSTQHSGCAIYTEDSLIDIPTQTWRTTATATVIRLYITINAINIDYKFIQDMLRRQRRSHVSSPLRLSFSLPDSSTFSPSCHHFVFFTWKMLICFININGMILVRNVILTPPALALIALLPIMGRSLAFSSPFDVSDCTPHVASQCRYQPSVSIFILTSTSWTVPCFLSSLRSRRCSFSDVQMITKQWSHVWFFRGQRRGREFWETYPDLDWSTHTPSSSVRFCHHSFKPR